MSDYCYLNFSIKLKEDPCEEIGSAFVKGAIINSSTIIFGEIGGQFEIDLLKFDEIRRKGILRVPAEFAVKLRIALTLIAEFRGIAAIFQVDQASNQLPALLDTFIEF